MKSLRVILYVLVVAFATSASAQNFFSNEEPAQLFDIGLRLGINASNRTFPKGAFNQWSVNSWGTGVDAGCVVDINIRDFVSLQPGLFIETRSSNYAYAHIYYDKNHESDDLSQLGHDRSVNLTVPILVSLKLNLADNLRAIAEAGPYVQYYFYDSATDKVQVVEPQSKPTDPLRVSRAKPASLDVGLKIGGGISFQRRYSFFIHYLAGGKKAWKEPLQGGHNKEWLFTIGYNL